MNHPDEAEIVRPLIGITAEARGPDDSIILPSEYSEAVRRAGGEPIPLAPWAMRPRQVVWAFDGILLAGGGDIDPRRYGSIGHPEVYDVDMMRDLGEIRLALLMLSRKVPLFGICRGAQLLNVALGGNLIEHLPDVYPGSLRHRAEPPGMTLHEVKILSGSTLAQAVGTTGATIASWHHQGIRNVGAGLVPVAWSDDGCVEAVEAISLDAWRAQQAQRGEAQQSVPSAPTNPDIPASTMLGHTAAKAAGHPWLVGVQWHPELTAAHDPVQQRLFDAFVQAAREHARFRLQVRAERAAREATAAPTKPAFPIEGHRP